MARVSGRYGYMVNVLQGLHVLGGAARPVDVYDWLVARGLADPSDLATVQKDGGTRFRKEVRWARQELFNAGLLVALDNGRWGLGTAGTPTLTVEQAVHIVRIGARARHRHGGEAVGLVDDAPGGGRAGSQSATTGPAPIDWTGEVSRSAMGPASTYVLRFGDRDVWKVGFAGSCAQRLLDINRHIPVEALGEQWQLHRRWDWPTARLAYLAEQALLNDLTAYRTAGERLGCSAQILDLAWMRLTRDA